MNELRSSTPQQEIRWWNADSTKSSREALLRFLPCSISETRNFTSRKFYKIYYNNSHYIEHSLVDLKEQDPVYEYVDVLYHIAREHEVHGRIDEFERIKRLINTNQVYKVRGLKPLCDYYVNILVIDDKQQPENNGQVFVMKFGKSIWRKIKALPEIVTENDYTFNCFNLYEAPLFQFKSHYDPRGFIDTRNSEFLLDNLYPIADTKDEILDIVNGQTFKLKNLGIRKPYKDYDQLKKKFIEVLGRSYYENIGLNVPVDSPISDLPSVHSSRFVEEVFNARNKN